MESALDLVALAPAGQILLSAPLAEDPDVIADVISSGYRLAVHELGAGPEGVLLIASRDGDR